MFSVWGIFWLSLAFGPRIIQCQQQRVFDGMAPLEETLAGLHDDADTINHGCESAVGYAFLRQGCCRYCP